MKTQLEMYLDGRHEVHRARPAVAGGGHGLLGGSMAIWTPRPWNGDANGCSTVFRVLAIVLPVAIAGVVYIRLTHRSGTGWPAQLAA
ncbi:MAG: hypothetical protein ACIAS6_13370 [Phycisphaerales bacterium JB060]